MAEPLPGEDADGGRAAADAHAHLGRAVDDRRRAGLHDHARGRRRSPAPRPRRCTASSSASQVTLPSFLVPPVRCRTPPMREHLRAVFGRRHVADLLALDAHRRRLGAEMAVGVDLHLDAAVAEDALGHDGDGVDAVVLGRDDEGRRLVVGIGGAGADAGDERARGIERRAVPGGAGERRRACRPRPACAAAAARDRCARAGRSRWRSARRRRRGPAGCGTAPGRHRSARCRRPRRRRISSARAASESWSSLMSPPRLRPTLPPLRGGRS